MTSLDARWLNQAIALSHLCPPSSTAFSVGAVIIGTDDEVLATGFSRETEPHDHAEEAALSRLDSGDTRLASATLYTSLEPCSRRASRPRTCTELIIAAGLPRVVLAWREPDIFVDCEGVELLRAAGILVEELGELADKAMEANRHLLG